MAGRRTRVVALWPEPFDPAALSFLNVARLLTEVPLPIPRIDDVSGEEGVLLLEDLGDLLLQDFVAAQGHSERRRLYLEAIELLARLQHRGRELASDDYAPYRVAFDEDKLVWELEYFARHFVHGLLGVVLGPAQEETLGRTWRELGAELAALPRVLCHRDFHARNLIIRRGLPVVLDFQDARLGPMSYDLVSLLCDSYVRLEADFVEDMKESFCRRSGTREILSQWDGVALQRNLKALGTFGYQVARRGKEVYRAYVPPTVRMVEENLKRNPRWTSLRRVLEPLLDRAIAMSAKPASG
jgi:hypothetical protein